MGDWTFLPKFTVAMAERLEANNHKEHWQSSTVGYLRRRLHHEVGELMRAINSKKSAEQVLHEAADVANFAAMIADVYALECEESALDAVGKETT